MSSARSRIPGKVEELISNRYASAIESIPLKDVYYEGQAITAESTFLHPADLYLLTLLFKQALNETEFEPLIEDFNNNSLYTAKNFQTAYQEMSHRELQELVNKNKDFQRKLQRILRLQKPKFSLLLSSMGMDSSNSSHYISANFEYRGDRLCISIDDSFIDSLRTIDPNHAADKSQLLNYENRLGQLFRALLAPTEITIQLNRTIQGQEAANCGIHAIINKINHEHGLNLNPSLMVKDLRKGIENSYDSDLSALSNTVKTIIKNQQGLSVQKQPQIAPKESAVKPVTSPKLTNARYRFNLQNTAVAHTSTNTTLTQTVAKVPAFTPVNELFESCERIYTQAIDAIRKSSVAENLKIAAIRNLFLADNSKPQQPVSSFRPIVVECQDIIASAQRALQTLEETGPKTSQFASGLKSIRDQHKAIQNTLVHSLSGQPAYRH